jgi:bacterioferritin
MPTVTPKPVRTSENARKILCFDLDNENATIRNYRERVRQREAIGEFAMAEQIRQILVDEQGLETKAAPLLQARRVGTDDATTRGVLPCRCAAWEFIIA